MYSIPTRFLKSNDLAEMYGLLTLATIGLNHGAKFPSEWCSVEAAPQIFHSQKITEIEFSWAGIPVEFMPL